MSNVAHRFGHRSYKLALIILIAGIWGMSGLVLSRNNASVSSTESVTLYSSANLTTPKSVFNPGEKVWALGSVSPLGLAAGSAQRRIQWVAPDGSIKQQRDISADTASDSYQIPASAPIGTWLVKLVDISNVGVAATKFVVRDPAKPAADLAIKINVASQISAGDKLTYQLMVSNSGPDDAENIELEDFVSKDATLLSVDSPQDWRCSATDIKANCAGSRLANGASVVFTLVFQVNGNTPANSTILNTAAVSSSTMEPHQPDNHSSAVSKILATACTLGCPEDVIRSFDAGVNGAIVSYAEPESSQACGNMICNPSSGSFFPPGVTTVVCSSEKGNHCNFKVTITGTVAINVIGANPLLVECHSDFRDAEVTAQNGNGDSIPVTSSGNVDMDVIGTYVITYTATDGTSTATATRTINVVDTTPPTINCPTDLIALAGANCKAVVPNVTGKVKVFDSCTTAEALVITQTPAAGTLTGVGLTPITITAKDAVNNVSTCTMAFLVNSMTPDSVTVMVGAEAADGAGVKFDLLAEVIKNGKLIGSGQVNDITGESAVAKTIYLASPVATYFCSGDTLSIRLSVRVAASSNRRGVTARLRFNEAATTGNFVIRIGGITNSYFFLNGFALGVSPGVALPNVPQNPIDVFVDRGIGNNFKPFGTWSKIL